MYFQKKSRRSLFFFRSVGEHQVLTQRCWYTRCITPKKMPLEIHDIKLWNFSVWYWHGISHHYKAIRMWNFKVWVCHQISHHWQYISLFLMQTCEISILRCFVIFFPWAYVKVSNFTGIKSNFQSNGVEYHNRMWIFKLWFWSYDIVVKIWF